MGLKAIDRKLLAIYRKTNFFVQDLQGKLTRFTAKTAHRLPFLKTKKFAVITAWNPMGKKAPLAQNRRQNKRLEKDLKAGGYSFYKTQGRYRSHREESFTIEKISKTKALALGKKYNQFSILYNNSKGVQFLRC